MYARYMEDDLQYILHEAVQDALRFAPEAIWCGIATQLPNNRETALMVERVMDDDDIDLDVRIAAARYFVERHPPHRCSFAVICELTPHCVEAAVLMDRYIGEGDMRADQAERAVEALVRRKSCDAACVALMALADDYPLQVMRGGGLLVALRLGRSIEAVEAVCPDTPQTAEELLVYARVHGEGPAHILSAVMKCTDQVVRGIYADQYMTPGEAPAPVVHPLDEGHTGRVTFQPSGFTMLRAPLAAASEFFRSKYCTDTVTIECDPDVLRQFRELVYYDTPPKDADAVHVAALADMWCANRAAFMCVDAIAHHNFWLAYDMAKNWPYVHELLRHHVYAQMSVLARGDRMPEIADYL